MKDMLKALFESLDPKSRGAIVLILLGALIAWAALSVRSDRISITTEMAGIKKAVAELTDSVQKGTVSRSEYEATKAVEVERVESMKKQLNRKMARVWNTLRMPDDYEPIE